ncbi:hypothetical protein OA497_02825 [Alphaproteobacteria bacterium]|nr:hypothetical protein [Alphaproteobacteria bacterium]
MIKNKFIICSVLSFFLVACSLPNPLKKESKAINKDCPQSLILYEARSLDLGNANIELQNEYALNCYLFVDENKVEISTDYKLNVLLSEEEKNTYKVELIIFVTNINEDNKIAEFQYFKDLKLDREGYKWHNFNLNDKFQIDLDTYDQGIKIFYAIN